MTRAAPPDLSPMALLRREMAVREGAVPAALDGVPVGLGQNLLLGGEFLMREPGVGFHYRRGAGVTVERGAGWESEKEALILNGRVYAAVASLNGLLPLHASAVVIGGRAIAFTGPSGGGKSTIAAALVALGLPLFCDDTLVVAPGGAGPLLALPGHKRMKLWPDAVALTGSAAQEQVSADYAKFYVTSSGSSASEPLPLGGLVCLEIGEGPALLAATGGEKMALLADDHYTRELYQAANPLDGAAHFAFWAGIARRLAVFRFVRPHDRLRFAETTRFLADALCAMMPA